MVVGGWHIAAGYLGNWVAKNTIGYIPVYGVPHTAKEMKSALIHNGWTAPADPIETALVENVNRHAH